MKVLTKVLVGGVGLAALASAAPAAAQYYPGYGYPGYGYGGGIGAVIDQILGGNRYAYGVDQRALVNQCIAAVTNRIEREYGYRYGGAPYGGYGAPYGGYGAYGQVGSNARVLGITSIEPRRTGVRVRGVATANANVAAYGGHGAPYGNPYGGGYGYAQPSGELTFKCNIDHRGRITDIDLDRSNYAYGYPYRRGY